MELVLVVRSLFFFLPSFYCIVIFKQIKIFIFAYLSIFYLLSQTFADIKMEKVEKVYNRVHIKDVYRSIYRHAHEGWSCQDIWRWQPHEILSKKKVAYGGVNDQMCYANSPPKKTNIETNTKSHSARSQAFRDRWPKSKEKIAPRVNYPLRGSLHLRCSAQTGFCESGSPVAA